MAEARNEPIQIGGKVIGPGERATIDLPLSLLSDHTPITLTVLVISGQRPGPRLLVNAAVHGDEVNGVEIVRRLIRHRTLDRLSGTLIVVPVVNVFGFVTHTRYLPDRRDLNRSFPGSTTGSLASQLANLFVTEVMSKCTHAVDLHTGAIHRSNLPQVRADLSSKDVRLMARAFGMPVILNAAMRPGSLRQTAFDMGIPLLLFEGGEALRFDDIAIQAGLDGILRLMRSLEMIRSRTGAWSPIDPVVSNSSVWMRAPRGGVVRTPCKLGELVRDGDRLGIVSSPFGEGEEDVLATTDGIVIGRSSLPVVNQGDALFHVAKFADPRAASEAVETFYEDWEGD